MFCIPGGQQVCTVTVKKITKLPNRSKPLFLPFVPVLRPGHYHCLGGPATRYELVLAVECVQVHKVASVLCFNVCAFLPVLCCSVGMLWIEGCQVCGPGQDVMTQILPHPAHELSSLAHVLRHSIPPGLVAYWDASKALHKPTHSQELLPCAIPSRNVCVEMLL